MKVILRKIHRYSGFFLAGFVLFYCLTGILLNHRQSFGYFTTLQQTEQRVTQIDLAPLNQLLEFYQNQINRPDAPKIIRIKGTTIEFLYGSHGQTTYSIEPLTGQVKKAEKFHQQPYTFFNQLHQAAKVSPLWLWVSDLVSLGIIAMTITGIVLSRCSKFDYLMLGSGLAAFGISLFLG